MEKVITEALLAREAAYAPYSKFKVGAALLLKDGSVIRGCNVENASYGLCNCAERTAIFAAVADGYRKFDAISIIGHRRGESVSEACPPCGICRQVISEFADSDFLILLYDGKEIFEYKLSEILPLTFDKSMM